MSKIELKQFQEEAINFISSELENKEIVKLQSPTGSGKTIMSAKIIEKFLKKNNYEFFQKTSIIYISLSSGGLDYQCYKKINKLLDDKNVNGFNVEYIGANFKTKNHDFKKNNYIQGINEFKVNTIYFMGWGILSSNSKIFKEGEEDNIFNVIRRTKFSKTKILLIIDEAHRDNPFLESKKSIAKARLEFLKELDPKRQLWMSATFLSLNKGIEPDFIVKPEDVKAAGVIKQNIIINSFINSQWYEWNDDSINRKLIKNALHKRAKIKKSISKTIQKFNPLILIQIPDGNPKFKEISVNNYYLKLIDEILETNGLKKQLNYGVYLSEIKTNTKNEIESMTSPLQVIVFKQAIATGWDIPRANILVKLRNPSTKTISFELQTLGRILRNPYLKIYKRGGKLTNEDVDNLNNSFIYTNDKNYSSYIKDYQNNIENDKLKKDNFPISKKAKKIKLNLNYLSINDEYWKKILIEIEKYFFNNKKFFKQLLLKIDKFYKNNNNRVIIRAKKFDGADVANNKSKIQHYDQTEIDFNTNKEDKEDMYFIYIQFLQVTNGFWIIEKIIRIISKQKECNHKIKKLFYYFIDQYDEIFEDEITLKQKINFILYKIIEPHIKYNVNENFTLPNEFSYYKEKTNKLLQEQEDFKNSYLMKINTTSKQYKPFFDSLQEHLFFHWFNRIKEYNKNEFHLFRNGVNPKNSYFIEYFDIESIKKRKFFPDFIITKKKKIIIIEIKGIGKNNIDSKSEIKLMALSHDVKKMNQKKDILIFKVGSNKFTNNENNLICYEYINGRKSESKNLNYLKEKILSI